jgi:mannonate dehydratase
MTYTLNQLMRWYGPDDIVPLEHIAQAGCEGVVSALHHIPVGEVWTAAEIKDYKSRILEKGLDWTVVESLPVHEAIKYGGENRDALIENYKQSLINLSKHGVKVVTYNFMPVLDWLRTDTSHPTTGGARTLYFHKLDYAVFDLFLLKRESAEAAYSAEELAKIRAHFEQLSEAEIARIEGNIMLALPGEKEDFTYEKIQSLLDQYSHIDTEQLKKNLNYFLGAVLPTAEEYGMQMAIHPDDPPFSILGLPRILSTSNDVRDMVAANPSPANGLCFCTGSYGARTDNNILAMMDEWSDRIFFLHLRNTARDAEGNFMEANHLEGDTNMYGVVKKALQIMQQQKRRIPMRPDHGFAMLDDLQKSGYPGYTAIGRMKSLAELRGVEYAILNAGI